MTILDQLAEHARERVERAKQSEPPAQLKQQALSAPKGDFAFEKALKKPGMACGSRSGQTGALPRKRRKRNGRLRFVVCWWLRYAHFRFSCSISAICFR